MKLFKRKEEVKLEDLLHKDNIGFYQMLKPLTTFIENEIESIGFKKPEYKINCMLRDFHGYKSGTMGQKYNSEEVRPEIKNKKIDLTINKKLIDAYVSDGYEEFNKMDLFMIVFHELNHLKFDKMFMEQRIDNQDLIKDRALSKYFYNITGKDDYYNLNYNRYTEEVLCNIYGVNDTIEFFKRIGVEIKEDDMKHLKEKYDLNCDYLQDKKRINPIDNKEYSLDELYEELILHNNIKR